MNAIISVCLFLIFVSSNLFAQVSCDELKEYVRSEDYGMTYYSYGSEAITKVSFYEVSDDSYNTFYFAIVQFTSSYTEYIYQVSYNTKMNYALDYSSGAGEAFWAHIHPYRDVLGCAPDF